jgi:hypothetical protein
MMRIFSSEAERLTFLTRHFGDLQTLRLAPMFAPCIVSPWLRAKGVTMRIGFSALGLTLVVFCLWFWALGRYYRRYGQVAANTVHEKSYAFPILGVLCLLFIVFLLIVRRQPLAPGATMLLVATLFLLKAGLSASNVPLRRLYYVGVSALLFLSLLPVFFYGAPEHRFFGVYLLTFFGLAGVTLGILDHLLLIYSFRFTSRELHA